MIRLGVVAAGPAVRIADGTQASAGDLILCTRNDHTVHAREPGRTLANGDLLRIEQVTAAGLIVRRALDADPATGQRQWTDRTFLYQHGLRVHRLAEARRPDAGPTASARAGALRPDHRRTHGSAGRRGD